MTELLTDLVLYSIVGLYLKCLTAVTTDPL